MKIYNQDKWSEFEAWYLQEELSSYLAECEVFVNPKNRYLLNKIIIVSNPYFDYQRLVGKNLLISRFPLNCSDYLLIPYKITSTQRVRQPFYKTPDILNLSTFQKFVIIDEVLTYPDSFISAENIECKGYLTPVGVIAFKLGLLQL